MSLATMGPFHCCWYFRYWFTHKRQASFRIPNLSNERYLLGIFCTKALLIGYFKKNNSHLLTSLKSPSLCTVPIGQHSLGRIQNVPKVLNPPVLLKTLAEPQLHAVACSSLRLGTSTQVKPEPLLQCRKEFQVEVARNRVGTFQKGA